MLPTKENLRFFKYLLLEILEQWLLNGHPNASTQKVNKYNAANNCYV
jgi:hypothetical protein